ncbi:hypothetical protein ACLG6S_09180 [Thermodesulfobacteriota bacterium B35]
MQPTGKQRFFFFFVILLLVSLLPVQPAAARFRPEDASWQQTVELFRTIPCLTGDELAYGREIIRGIGYGGQRIFRRMCRMPGISFEKSRQAWKEILSLDLSFEQVLCFEKWSELPGVDMDLALTALPEIKKLSYEAGRSFRRYLHLPRISARHALDTIPLLSTLKDANNRAVQGFLAIDDMDAIHALDGMVSLALLKDNQARACGAFAEVAGMDTATMLDALPLLRQLRQDDAWNARCLFRQKEMTREEAWRWLIRYFALPPEIQEKQYYRLDDRERGQLLQAFYDGGEELIWKINNLHAITDRFGFEIPDSALRRFSSQQLYERFQRLSPQVRFRFGNEFYPLISGGNRAQLIGILRRATAADRLQTARDLVSADIYALLSQGSELYDSSFRDILVPVLKKRIDARYSDSLLDFLRETDPANMLVADFIVSLAQKGKLTTFFPEDDALQRQILELVAASAFRDEDSILLFSATFMHLLQVLAPDARSFLIRRMADVAENGSGAFTRLVNVILQYYLKEYPDLLSPADRSLILRLAIRKGVEDLGRYQQTPFARWKSDHRLASVSIFHPDDDGRSSFLSNVRTLLRAGYRFEISDTYSLTPPDEACRRRIGQLTTAAKEGAARPLLELFRAMERDHFSVALARTMGNITISHAQYVYSGEENQERLLERFLRSGDEMLAQRGHSYWRSEQLTEPLEKLRRQRRISDRDLTDKQRFLSLGSCGGVKAYTRLTRMFLGHVDILATIGTGMAIINDPYNRNLFEVVATGPDTMTWKEVAERSAFIFKGGRGQDYLQPGSLTAILHKIIEEKDNRAAAAQGRTGENHAALQP